MRIGILDSGIGVIPFIKDIIKNDKRNKYYIYIDRHNFPYGNKDDSFLKNRLISIINIFAELEVDKIYIACNTLSYIFMKSKIKTNIIIKTILQINLQHYTNNVNLLMTSFLYNKLKEKYNCIDGENLAFLIENNKINDIIKYIKKIPKNKRIILCCTHYHMVKDLFDKYYDGMVLSYEEEFIFDEEIENEFEIYVNKDSLKILEKYLDKISIKVF